MNVFILGGGGTIGSATAAYLAWKEIVDTIYILDVNGDIAESHVMDLSQATFPFSRTKIKVGSWPDLADCQLLIIAAGLPVSAMTDDYCKNIAGVMPIISAVAEAMNRYNPQIPVLSMTNPLDAFNYTLYNTAKLPAKQFFALSLNDTLRFQWALAPHLNCSPEQVECYVVGEHGPRKLHLFSTVSVEGQSKEIPPSEQEEVREEMSTWWKHFLEVSGARTAGWTSGAAAGQVVEAVAGIRKSPIPCSVIREEGQGFSIGWPVYLDQSGVAEFLELSLTEEESNQFEIIKQSLKEIQSQILTSLASGS